MAVNASVAQSEADVQNEIDNLEARLEAARSRLKSTQLDHATDESREPVPREPRRPPTLTSRSSRSPDGPAPLGLPTHFLLLLSDSALPLGSFAFSSGLESYLAHTPTRAGGSFSSFLPSSISSLASTTLPFVLAAHREPASLADLDDQLDAAVICTVGRRASVAQGRALLSIWERSFRSTLPRQTAADASLLRDFADQLRESKGHDVPPVSAHLGPLFGAICSILGLSLRQTAYMFVLSHVKALVSAAVRASMFGPYQAQKVLAGENVQRMIDVAIEREWNTPVEEAGQTVPVLDLWIGRHEVLYSRIFNS